jgi:hypothetical protein
MYSEKKKFPSAVNYSRKEGETKVDKGNILYEK